MSQTAPAGPSGTAIVGLKNKVTLSETSFAGPALARLQDLATPSRSRLYMAWTGLGNLQLNAQSSADGTTFEFKQTLTETGIDSPALAIFERRGLMIAWAGTDSERHLNVMPSELPGPPAFHDKVVLGQTKSTAPSLGAWFDQAFPPRSRLFLAWAGLEDQRLNRLASADGTTFDALITLSETSMTTPAITVFGDSLAIAWAGTDAQHHLNVMSAALPDAANFRNKVTLGDTSTVGPALAVHNSLLWMAWTGGDQRLNLMASADGFQTIAVAKHVVGDTSIAAPALASFNSRLWIGWTGTDSGHHINLAEVELL